MDDHIQSIVEEKKTNVAFFKLDRFDAETKTFLECVRTLLVTVSIICFCSKEDDENFHFHFICQKYCADIT